MLKDLLDAKKCFKLVCGAGNENEEEVYNLVKLYAQAGCKFFDLCAKEEIVLAAKRALKDCGVEDAYICVSVGIKNDPHVSKAMIDTEKCVQCGKCQEICPQRAIRYCKVKERDCIGCGRCLKVCHKGAISFYSKEKELKDVLPPIINLGVDCIEFHAMGLDEAEIDEKWAYINSIYSGMLSICTGRGKLGDEQMVARIKKMVEGRAPYSTIIQADGFPMSGGQDDYKTTLQTVAACEIVQNAKLPVYLFLSGGTNSKTAELAKMCGISYNGIAIGSFARKIIKNTDNQLGIAENLIKSTL